jgi:hypothetical protein
MQTFATPKCVLLALSVILVVGCDTKDEERSDSGDANAHAQKDIRSLAQSPRAFQPVAFERAVRAYESGDVVADNGVVLLPDDLAGITADGRLYVTRPPRSTLYFFITWRGKGSNLRGYLYQSSQQQTSSDRKALAGTIEVVGPTVRDPGYGKIGIDIEESLGQGWYKVKRDVD